MLVGAGPASECQSVMPQQILDYHKPLPREAAAQIGASANRAACAILRIASRAGAIGQVCIAFAALALLTRDPRTVAMIFWRQEAMIATAAALFWVACASNNERRQAVAFLAANVFGWGVSLLLPILN
jgi:hypothetical protein